MLANHQGVEPACPGNPHLLDQVGELRAEIRALAPLGRHVKSEFHHVSSRVISLSRTSVIAGPARWQVGEPHLRAAGWLSPPMYREIMNECEGRHRPMPALAVPYG